MNFKTIRPITAIAFGAALSVTAPINTANAEVPEEGVQIGVITDLTGPYSDLSGPGSVAAAELAAEEFGGQINGKPIEIMSADHQNKADIAATIARKWFDEDGVDMVIDFPNSSTALAVQEIARQKERIAIFASTGTTQITNEACSPFGFQWMYDTYSHSVGLVDPLIEQGLDTFFIVYVDYAFGHALEAAMREVLEERGKTVLGSETFALNTPDLSAPLLTAKASGADAVIIAAAGTDNVNGVKTSREFGLPQDGQTIVVPTAMITDIHAMGLEAAQGAMFVDGFYWNMDDEARQFGARFEEKTGKKPTMGQAGVYSGTRHYLQAIKDADTIDASAVAEEMRSTPVEDAVVRNGHIRADGRLVKDMYIVRVKSPADSTEEWDLEEVVTTIPGDKAFMPIEKSKCDLVQ